MRIITITLNPAFDVHCSAKELTLYHENFVTTTAVDAGGKGINLSRALLANGIQSQVVVVVGRENAAPYETALLEQGLQLVPIVTDGRIRENITIHEADRPETRVSFNGFSCSAEILREITRRIGQVDENTVIAFTGSAPAGIDGDQILDFLEAFRRSGAKIVIDSRSIPFQKLLAFRPWLIKPNQDEAAIFSGRKVTGPEDAVAVAGAFHRAGIANVLLTLGGDGAVLACDEGIFRATVPAVEAKSTIGAGDSTIAGFIAGTMQGLQTAERLKRAVAYGTAACMQAGTLPPHKADVERIEQGVVITHCP